MEVLRYGYRIPFLCKPPLTKVPISLPSYHPSSTKGVALGEATRALVAKSAMELAPLPSLGFYSLLFVVWKTSGSWRPVIDLSILNLYMDVSHFRMETIQSVLLSVRQGDWMASIDLKEAYLQVPVHLDSRSFLRFVAQGNVYPFSALCFSLSTGLLTGHGSCFRHSPFLGYPHEAVPRRLARPVILSRVSLSRPQCGPRSLPRTGDCCESGEVSPRAFPGSPASRGGGRLAVFPGFSIAGARRQASVNHQRISILRRSSSEYLAFAARHAVLSLPSRSRKPSSCEISPTLSPQVLGSRGPVSQDSLDSRLPQGSSVVARPSLSVSWGVSGSGISGSGLLVRRLRRGLGSSSGFSHRFRPLGCRSSLSVHQCSRASGHQEVSPPLPLFSGREECGGILRQLHSSVISPQGGGHTVAVPQLPGSGNSPLDGVPLHPTVTPVHSGVPERSGGLSLSLPHQLRHTEWSLHPEVFRSISHMWPVQLDLFATSANRQCSVFFSPFRDPLVTGTDAFLQRWDGLQAYAFPPWSVIPRVLAKFRVSPGTELALIAPYWPRRAWFPDLLHLSLAPPVALPLRRDLLRLPQSPQASPSSLERLRRFTRAAGFSSTVASQASLSRRPYSRKAYQLKWQVYRAWCHSHGHSVSRLTLSKVAEFLCWFRSAKNLGVSSIRGYRSMLSAVFRFQLPSLSSHPVLRDLLRSFCLESAESQLRPQAWDLSLVLRFLNTSTFEPLSAAPLRALTQKVLFLLALATAKRVGELQALFCCHLRSWDACLMSLSSLPSRSRSPAPSLAPSWLSPCPILLLVWMTTSCFARYGLFAFIWTGYLLCVLFAIVFSCLLVAPHVPSLRTQCRSSSVT